MALPPNQPKIEERYVDALLLDEAKINERLAEPGRTLLREYSHIPDEDIVKHVGLIVRGSAFPKSSTPKEAAR